VTPEMSFGLLQNDWNLSYDTDGGSHPYMYKMANYLSSFYTQQVTLDISGEGPSLLSGIDTRTNQTAAYIQINAPAHTLTGTGGFHILTQSFMRPLAF
jgi:hypothetical protein